MTSFLSSELASVLRMINRGEFLRVLRPPLRPSSYSGSAGLRTDRPSSIVTLGRTIIICYLAALMAAMISARVLPEGEVDRPEVRSKEVSGPPPIIFDG